MHERRSFERVCRAIATVGPPLFFAIATIAGSLRAGYDPVAQPISALALGPEGWIQELNFVLLIVSWSSFAVVLRRQLSSGVASVAGPGVLAVMTVGVVLAVAFPMDAPGAPATLIGRLHVVGGFLVFPQMPIALLVVARRFRRDPRWRPYFGYTLATALLSLATVVFFLIFVGPPGSSPRVASEFAGLVQRVQLVPFLAWVALVAHRARHRAGDDELTFRAGIVSAAHSR